MKYGKAKLIKSLNAVLPEDIAIKKINLVSNDFHARYSAKSRIYRYYMVLAKPAYNYNKFYYLKTKFDIDLAKEFCKLLAGKHSFRSLCKNREDKHGFYCEVFNAGIRKLKNGILEFEINANRYLHSMVRAIAGSMIKVASGKLTITEFKQKFNKGEHIKIQYAPSNALVLYKINY